MNESVEQSIRDVFETHGTKREGKRCKCRIQVGIYGDPDSYQRHLAEALAAAIFEQPTDSDRQRIAKAHFTHHMWFPYWQWCHCTRHCGGSEEWLDHLVECVAAVAEQPSLL